MANTLKKGKVLVADADPEIRKVCAEILEFDDYIVKTVNDGQEAWEQYNKSPDFQLIIADIQMPRMGGLDLIKNIRLIGKDIPIIILTSNKEVSTALEALNSGASDYLLKDDNIRMTIVCAAEKVLEKKRLLDRNSQLVAGLNNINKKLEGIAQEIKNITAEKEQLEKEM